MIIHEFMLRCCGVCRFFVIFVGIEFSSQDSDSNIFKSLVRIRFVFPKDISDIPSSIKSSSTKTKDSTAT